jgi:hypothetical protein
LRAPPLTGYRFYGQIVEKYIKFCGSTDNSSDLEGKLASFALPSPPTASSGPPSARSADFNNPELANILLSMRKLREGIIGSKRVDAFSSKVYMFIIRASILMRHSESYHPALQHLLYDIHPYVPLSSNERQEFAGYLMLHLASKTEAYTEACCVKHEFQVTDHRILQAISAMVHGNYWSFRATRRRVDLYKARLMECAERRMREHALKCLAKTYFKVEVDYVEAVMGMSWDSLKKDFAVGWEVEEGIVTVRKQKTSQAVQPTTTTQLDRSFQAW